MSALLQEVPVYWLNFALHTAVLSAVAWAACILCRDAGRRAFLAAGGVFLIGVQPWISALRPFSSIRTPAPLADVERAISPAWPEWTIRLEEPDSQSGIVVREEMPAAAAVASSPEWMDWRRALIGLWLAGAIGALGRLMWRQARLVRWARSLRAADDEEWPRVRGSGALQRDQVRIVDAGMSPCAVGFFRPKAVLPRFLFEAGMERKLEWALRHEAGHVRKRDSRVAVMLAAVRAVMWWNPFVGWLCGVWAEERERVCDALASQGNGERRDYGRFLLEMAERAGGRSDGAVAMAERGPAARLRRRLESLVKGVRVKEASMGFRAGSSLAAAVVVIAISTAGIRKAVAVESPAAAKAPVDQAVSREKPADRNEAEPSDNGRAVRIQVRMNSTFLLLPEPLPETGEILDLARSKAVLKRLAGSRGNVLMTSPSVTAVAGQMAMVEIIREGPPGQAGEEPPFVGMRSKLVAEVTGEKITLRVEVQFNHAPGESPLPITGSTSNGPNPVPGNFDWSSVKSATAKDAFELKPGETKVLAFQSEDPTRHLIGLFTATPVDATGRPADSTGSALPEPMYSTMEAALQESPLPEWQGDRVKIRAAIVELADDGKLGPYFLSPPEGVPGFRSSFSNRHFGPMEAIARSMPGETAWQSLMTTSISSAAPSVPWESFPVRIETGPPQGNSRPVRLRLPGESREIEASGQLAASSLANCRVREESGCCY